MEPQSDAQQKRGVGRPSKAQPFRAFVVDLLLGSPHMKSLEIVKRARQSGYDGGKSALYAVIASVRPRRSRPLGQQDRVPGEIIRHGFGQADVVFGNGETRQMGFLISRLEYSRWITVSLLRDQGLESLVRSLVRHYRTVGGVPMLAAFDRPKLLATRTGTDGHVLEWDPAFAYAMVELGLGVEVRARRGSERGPGTNLGNWIKQAFFKGRVFTSPEDIDRQLQTWAGEVNATSTPENGGQSPALMLTEERRRLRALRVEPDALALRFPVVVGPRATVLFEGQPYAMPPDSTGLVGALYLHADKVVIVAGRHQATHPRHTTGAVTTAVRPPRGASAPGPGFASPSFF